MISIILVAITAITTIIYVSLFGRETLRVLKVSTTTSLYVTGLLEKLSEEFRKEYPDVVIQFIAVGTGRALEIASRGDVDMVFVHAPSLEHKYIKRGILVDGRIIAYNYFVIGGPKDDPAGIKGLNSPVKALKRIYNAGVSGMTLFISRGDNSGTHIRELALWRRAGLNPIGQKWYIESGTGMSKTLMIANERKAYTLSDIGTYLKLKGEGILGRLEVLVDKGEGLINIYSAYIVNPDKYKVDYE
ncbi:tungsten ABC transporter permease, partial [archaeon]